MSISRAKGLIAAHKRCTSFVSCTPTITAMWVTVTPCMWPKKLRITSKCITIKQERSWNTYIIEHCAVIRRLKFLLFQWWTLQYLLTVLFVFAIGTLQLQKEHSSVFKIYFLKLMF